MYALYNQHHCTTPTPIPFDTQREGDSSSSSEDEPQVEQPKEATKEEEEEELVLLDVVALAREQRKMHRQLKALRNLKAQCQDE